MPRVQQKRGTDANLTSVDPTPLAGELIVVSDENSLKIGNGVDSYTSLAYATATPRSHKSTHATGGSDALSPSDIGAAPAASPTFSGTVTARNDASANTYPLTVANGQNWAWGVGINFAQPATSGGAITDTARLVSDFDSTGNFSFRFHTMGGGTLAERMRITGAGRLAINAASDTVNHMIVARGSSTGDGAILLKSSSTGTAANDGFLLQCFGANSDAYVWQYENSPLIFGTNSTERMRLTAGGDLAIGRTSAASALDVNGVITVSAGSAAAPAICASGDANTGLAFPAADTAIISTGGVERLRVDAIGNVGIGATPSQFSSSFNNLVVGNGSSVEGATIYSTTQGTLAFGDTATTAADGFRGYLAYIHTTDYMVIGTGGAERLRANSAGITVSGVITVSAGSAAAPALCPSGDANTGLAFPAADTAIISTAGVERVRVDSGLRVLQPPDGTSVARMSLLAASGTTIAAENILYGDSYTASSLMGIGAGGFVIYGAARPVGICTTGSNGILFGTNAAERMRITGTGRVGIGRTSPDSALDVNGVITVSAGSAAAPAVCFSGDSNTGIAQIGGADSWSVVTAGTERVRVGSTGASEIYAPSTGNVTLVLYTADSGAALRLRGRSDNSTSIQFVANAGTLYGQIVSTSSVLSLRAPSGGRVDLTTSSGTGVLQAKSTGSVRFVPLAADPASGNEAGDVYYNSSTNKLRVYDGTSWVDYALAAGATFTGTTTFNGPVTEGYVAGGNTGTAKTIALTNGTVQAFTLTGNCTFTMPTAVAGQSFTVLLKTGAGSYTATFTGVKWPNGVAPTITTAASKLDMVVFVSDGTNWYGSISQNYGV